MSGPKHDDSGKARGLDDILREAGVSTAGGGRRRRRADPDPDATQAEEPSAGVPDYRASLDQGNESDFGTLSSYLLMGPSAPTTERAPDEPGTDNGAVSMPAPRTDTGPVPTSGWATPRTPSTATPARSAPPWSAPSRPAARPVVAGAQSQSPSTVAAIKAAPPKAAAPKAAAPKAAPPKAAPPKAAPPKAAPTTAGPTTAAPTKAAASRSQPALADPGSSDPPSHGLRSRSPLALEPPEEPEDESSAVALHSGVASWAILGVELLAALGLGVGVWYAFSALWDLLPYVAAFAGPLVVTGLVAVAGALRARTGRNPLGLPTLCILVFAGMVLVILPAATLIVP